MAGERTLPGLGLTGYWDLGDDSWKAGMDANLRLLSIVSQLRVISRETALPAGSDGDIYIVPDDAPSFGGQIAAKDAGAWVYVAPWEGLRAWVRDEDRVVAYDGSTWVPAVDPELQNISLFGLGTEADSANPFSAKINKALWTALYVADGGNGDLFYTMNKELSTDDVGFLLQQNFVTKALIGLFGSNLFRLAMSADGSTYKDALSIDEDGIVDMPQLPRFVGYINFDQYVAANTWLKVPINNTEYNDQSAFDAGSNVFTAPVDGVYTFGAAIGWKQNGSNTPTITQSKFVKNGGGTPVDLSAPLDSRPLSGVATAGTELVSTPTITCLLDAGDTVELQQRFTSLDGYIPSTITRFWGYKVG